MNDPTPVTSVKAPRHLWIVGAVALVWNCIGALDYFMTETRNEGYMNSFTQEQLAYFYGLPAWVIATWAIAVWGAVGASVLLLLRKRIAVPVFAVSLLSAAITFFHNYVLTNGYDVMGGAGALAFSLVILAIGGALLGYSYWLSRRGVLR